MEIIDIEQRTDEWLTLRKGKFTGSEIWKLMVEPKSKSEKMSETAKSYVLEKISEIYSVDETPRLTLPALEWGTNNEPLAKKWYSRRSGHKVTEIGYVPLEGFEKYAGGSPDGVVDYRHLIEIKCPYNPANHIKHILVTPEDFKRECKEYYWQVQFYMLCLSLPHCDFISFDPRVNADWGLHVKTIYRNEEDIKLIPEKISIAVDYFNEILSRINETETKING